MATLADLHTFSIFENVPDTQLQWLLDWAIEATHPANYTLTACGDSIDHLRLLLDGRISIVATDGEDLLEYEAPAVLGLLPYSRLTEAKRPIVTDTPARLLDLHRDHLRDLTVECYDLTAALVQQMTDRVRNFTQQAQQEEKMASLGRLSAGLAHELNNPVSAIVRNADALKQHMRATPEAFKAH
jgi:signal transduction histidine kinase